MAGVDFVGSCPKCHGGRWHCHWSEKNNHTKRTTRVTAPRQVITPPGELLPLKRNGNSTPGPKIPQVPDDLIRDLAGQGLGVKAISTKLAEQGIVVSHMTIHRRLQGGLL